MQPVRLAIRGKHLRVHVLERLQIATGAQVCQGSF
jgi:hypothetical protein